MVAGWRRDERLLLRASRRRGTAAAATARTDDGSGEFTRVSGGDFAGGSFAGWRFHGGGGDGALIDDDGDTALRLSVEGAPWRSDTTD